MTVQKDSLGIRFLHDYLPRHTTSLASLSNVIKTYMEQGVLHPLADKQTIALISHNNPELGVFLRLVQDMNGVYDYGNVPRRDSFYVLDEPYTGADGKKRFPLPKYIPLHIVASLREMQMAYQTFLRGRQSSQNAPTRPGLIVFSAYRSHYYQLVVFARKIIDYGLDSILVSMELPGASSDHADYDYCGIDVMKIGDEYGKVMDHNGQEIDFLQTVEGQWLVNHATDFGFHHTYPPDRNNPLHGMAEHGKIPEPWHIKYVGSPKDAEKLSRQNGTRELFIKRLNALGGPFLLDDISQASVDR